MYQAESCEFFLAVSAVRFGDALREGVVAGTRMKPNWMLSTPASKNKTCRDASLLTSSWQPACLENLKFQGIERGPLQKLEMNPPSWPF